MAHRIVLLYQGKVQQIGSPLELYDDPENLFTASFIGTPTINQLSLTIRPGMTPLIENAPWLGASARKLADALPEGQFTVCIRPEALMPSAANTAGTVAVEVDYCEEMGCETVVWCRIRSTGTMVCLRLPRTDSDIARSITGVEPDWSRMLVFDASGNRIRFNFAGNAKHILNVELRRKA